MRYCVKCGSELRGAKNYCIACGAQQDKLKKEISETKLEQKNGLKETKVTELKSGKCLRCGELTDRRCFFCGEFVCRDHYFRMQANIYPTGRMTELKTHGERRSINDGWRGFIIFSCPKCSAIKERKELTDEEMTQINSPDFCSWYRLE